MDKHEHWDKCFLSCAKNITWQCLASLIRLCMDKWHSWSHLTLMGYWILSIWWMCLWPFSQSPPLSDSQDYHVAWLMTLKLISFRSCLIRHNKITSALQTIWHSNFCDPFLTIVESWWLMPCVSDVGVCFKMQCKVGTDLVVNSKLSSI